MEKMVRVNLSKFDFEEAIRRMRKLFEAHEPALGESSVAMSHYETVMYILGALEEAEPAREIVEKSRTAWLD